MIVALLAVLLLVGTISVFASIKSLGIVMEIRRMSEKPAAQTVSHPAPDLSKYKKHIAMLERKVELMASKPREQDETASLLREANARAEDLARKLNEATKWRP